MGIDVLRLRREELRRRLALIPGEIEAWTARIQAEPELQRHWSQIDALRIMFDVIRERQQKALDELDEARSVRAQHEAALRALRVARKGQQAWNYFRQMLQLRDSRLHGDALWVADTIAWDCFRSVLDKAVELGLLEADRRRAPPLTAGCDRPSPSTWVRGSRPYGGDGFPLDGATLPIPVIEVPWDHLQNPWDLLSLLHETAHDLVADLSLGGELARAIGPATPSIPPERAAYWSGWIEEVFCDLVAVRLGGPAYVELLVNMLLLPDRDVTAMSPGAHPPPHLRVLLLLAYCREALPRFSPAEGEEEEGAAAVRQDAAASMRAHADRLEQAWLELYPPTSDSRAFAQDFGVVIEALSARPLRPPKPWTLHALIPYRENDDVEIRDAAGYLLTGQRRPKSRSLLPRHCASAARLAVSQVVVGEAKPGDVAADALQEALASIQRRTHSLLRDMAPPALRAAPSSAREAFIRELAERFATVDVPPG